MADRPRILFIAGSVRPLRISPVVAAWIAGQVARGIDAEVELVDLADWPLPMDDEPGIPARGLYASPKTRAWSDMIAGGNAFVFVTPQYNWGYPAPLKNAIDHLYAEWRGKPAMIVTYGNHGGGKCAAQLREVLTGVKMRVVETTAGLTLSRANIEANAGKIDPAKEFATDVPAISAAIDELRVALSHLPGG